MQGEFDLVRVGDHAAELENLKRAAVTADSLVLEEDRPAAASLDQDRPGQQDWKKDQDADAGGCPVEEVLHDTADTQSKCGPH